MYDDFGMLSDIEALSMENAVSIEEFEEYDRKAEIIANKLGMNKKDIFSMSEVELESLVNEKDIGLTLSDDKNSELDNDEVKEKNKKALENIKGKQETSLDKKVDTKHTLGEILGVPTGSKLIAVGSDKIENNEISTRFSFVIEYPDGTIAPADMLNQIGGIHSDKNVYETNRDGSEVEKKNVQSSFAIDSPLVKNGSLNVRYDAMGTLAVNFAIIDKTSNKEAFGQRLETREVYRTERNVLREFGQSKGTDNISENLNEIRGHENFGCDNLTLAEADGDNNTGHNHSDEAASKIIASQDYGTLINDTFTLNEIKERFEDVCERYPETDFDKLVEITKDELAEDARHIPTPERGY